MSLVITVRVIFVCGTSQTDTVRGENMSDSINRQAAIRIAEQGQIQGFEWQFKKLCELLSEPLYTPDELQTMQDLEWSQMEKMYELGKAEALQRTQMSLTEPQEEPNAEWRKKHYEMSYNQGFIDACKYYENLPERKNGQWIEVDDDLIRGRCSECGWEAHLYEDDVVGMSYCPNCGADMRG